MPISLAQHLNSDTPVPEALRAYQEERKVDVMRLQNSAHNAMVWFEHVPPATSKPSNLKQFNYSMLTRSQRVSHENLRLRDPEWLAGMEKHLAQRAIGEHVNDPVPPMFLPFKIARYDPQQSYLRITHVYVQCDRGYAR